MNLKKLAVGAAIAAAAVGGGMAVTAPAQAATLNTLNFTSPPIVRLDESGSTATLNFADLGGAFNGSSGTSALTNPLDTGVFGAVGTPVTIQDLVLTALGGDVWELTTGPIPNFITGFTPAGNFTLTSFRLQQISIPNGPTIFSGSYRGTFANLAGPIGVGVLTAQSGLRTEAGTTFSNTIDIPTPALLPGLVGMGVAALRKRKGETEPEAVKA
jgi:hypothetical protein